MADRVNPFKLKADKDKQEKQRVLHNQKKNDEALVRTAFCITEEDKRKLALHRVDTGESASAFVRRMIAQELD